jgi:hypothetical protein
MTRASEIGVKHDAESRLWGAIEEAHRNLNANRLLLGKLCLSLKHLYSERSADSRLSSGRGTFLYEVKARGYKIRTVNDWINDYISDRDGKPSTSTKRKARRVSKAEASAIFIEMQGPALTRFAAILPYPAAKAAYLTAAKLFHPDHAGDEKKMQELNMLWAEVEPFYKGSRADWEDLFAEFANGITLQ